MADESINIPLESENLDYHIVTLLEKIENLRIESYNVRDRKLPLRVEIRTLEFWKSVICECLASFIYVFIVCGAAAGAGAGASLSSVMLATALSAGFTMATLNQCFGHISGAHVNPAVSIAMGVTKSITMLRSGMFVIAQCGGGIAGAAFLYGVTVPGYQGNLAAAVSHTSSLPAWERFGVEFILTFVVVLTYFVSMERTKRWSSNASINIGFAYAACTFVSMPYLNPARSLGPSFVLNQWDNHWVYWMGPTIGGVVSGLVYGHIINPTKHKFKKEAADEDSSSIHSDEDTYDDLDKPTPPKFHGSTYNTYRAPNNGQNGTNYAGSLYGAPLNGKLERVESLYGGTKSLYCKSPPLTRANLNRSQSVYNKSTSAVNNDSGVPRPGPLVPAQSLYPMRFNQPTTHVHNQNAQNQMQQRSESIYGMRGITPGTSSRSDNYAATRDTERYARQVTGAPGNHESNKFEENQPKQRGRPDSLYGSQPRRQQNDDNYGSYGSNSTNQRQPNPSSNFTPGTYQQQPSKCTSNGNYSTRGEVRPVPPPVQGGNAQRPDCPNGFHSMLQQPAQHSPKTQY